ncbi:MAG: hypothetical protein QG597_1575, partial [Actinomycetota bacterium]|nr:hypothetical protein [Actinomycetota bacterium]
PVAASMETVKGDGDTGMASSLKKNYKNGAILVDGTLFRRDFRSRIA